MVVLAIARFTVANSEMYDEEAKIVSRFLKCDNGTDLSDKMFVAHVGAMLVQQSRDQGVITDDHVCSFLGLREIPHSEVVQLYEDTKA